MRSVVYKDLAQYGLPFVTRCDRDYEGLVAEICARQSIPDEALDEAAVILNQSGRNVVAMTGLWTYWPSAGAPRKTFESNFASTAVFDATGDRHSAFAAGSKRLITWQGTFGNNSDVIPTPEGKCARDRRNAA
jgi:hypothetical protein